MKDWKKIEGTDYLDPSVRTDTGSLANGWPIKVKLLSDSRQARNNPELGPASPPSFPRLKLQASSSPGQSQLQD